MLMVRLQRIGKRGQAYFRVIVVEHTKKPKGEYLELLGAYNPHEKTLKVKKDRIEFWISKGAQASPTVNNLLVNYKIWDKPKVQSWKSKKSKDIPKGGQTIEKDKEPVAKIEVSKEEQAPIETKPEETKPGPTTPKEINH